MTSIEKDEETKRRVSLAMRGIPLDVRLPPTTEPASRKPLGPHNVVAHKEELPVLSSQPSRPKYATSTNPMTQAEKDHALKQKYKTAPMTIPIQPVTKRKPPTQLVAPPSPARSVSSECSDKKPSPRMAFRAPISPRLPTSHNPSPNTSIDSPTTPGLAPMSLIVPSPSSGVSRNSLTVAFPKARRGSSPARRASSPARRTSSPHSPYLNTSTSSHSPITIGPPRVRRASDSSLPLLPTSTDLEKAGQGDFFALPPQAFSSPQRGLGDRKQRTSLPPQAVRSPHRIPGQTKLPPSSAAAQKHRLGDRKQRVSLPPTAIKLTPPASISKNSDTTTKADVSSPTQAGTQSSFGGDKKARVSLPPAALNAAAGATLRLGDRKKRVSLPPSALSYNASGEFGVSEPKALQNSKQRIDRPLPRASLPGAHVMERRDQAVHRKLGENKTNRTSLIPNNAQTVAELQAAALQQFAFSCSSSLSGEGEEEKEEVSAEEGSHSGRTKGSRSSFTQPVAPFAGSPGAFFVPAEALSSQDMEERSSFRLRRPSASSSLASSRPGSQRDLEHHDSLRNLEQQQGANGVFPPSIKDAEIDVYGIQAISRAESDIEVGATVSTTEGNSSRADVSAPMSVYSAPTSQHSSPRRSTVVKPKATRVQEDEEQVKPKKRCHCCNAPWWCNIMVPLILAGFVVFLVTVMVKGLKTDSDINRSTLPPVQQNKDVLLFENETLAPGFTLIALEDPNSPQSKAKTWLLADPNAWNYTQSRKLQRFALATLYYAAGGARWQNSSGWLDYDVHECKWFSAKVAISKPTSAIENHVRSSETDGDLDKLIACNIDLDFEYLQLAGDSLRGSIPAEISLLTSLKQINLESNKLFGPIPTEIGLMTKLDTIGLSINDLDGPVPTELGLLSGSLKNLYLRDNKLTGTVPTELAQLNDLRELDLTNNVLTSTIPVVLINKLSELEILRLGGNKLVGPIPSELGFLKKLTELIVRGNGLTGPIPSEIGSLPELALFGVALNTALDATIPTEFAKLSKLDTFDATSAGLRGTIPEFLGELTNLAALALDANKLEGSIPTQVGLLTNLKWLSLYDNRLTGKLPSELGNLSGLEVFYAYLNQLTSTIPTEFGRLTGMKDFQVFDNWISGEIPTEFGNLSSLATLAVIRTDLTGVFPDATCAMVASQQLTITADCDMMVCC